MEVHHDEKNAVFPLLLLLTTLPMCEAVAATPQAAGPTPTPAGESGQSTLRVYLTDKPAEEYLAVNVTVVAVRVHQSSDVGELDAGWIELPVTAAMPIDLLTLRNGVLYELCQANLPAGHYQQVRLELAPNTGAPPFNQSVVTADGVTHALEVPSGTVKIVHGVSVERRSGHRPDTGLRRLAIGQAPRERHLFHDAGDQSGLTGRFPSRRQHTRPATSRRPASPDAPDSAIPRRAARGGPLDFDHAVLDRPAAAAARLELLREGRERFPGEGEAGDQRDPLPFAAFGLPADPDASIAARGGLRRAAEHCRPVFRSRGRWRPLRWRNTRTDFIVEHSPWPRPGMRPRRGERRGRAALSLVDREVTPGQVRVNSKVPVVPPSTTVKENTRPSSVMGPDPSPPSMMMVSPEMT